MYGFNPLTDIWEDYQVKIEEAVRDGLRDSEEAEEILWPSNLHFGDMEKEDIEKFVAERTMELADFLSYSRKLDTRVLSSYIFRSVLSGLIWQKERQGN